MAIIKPLKAQDGNQLSPRCAKTLRPLRRTGNSTRHLWRTWSTSVQMHLLLSVFRMWASPAMALIKPSSRLQCLRSKDWEPHTGRQPAI